MRPARARPRGSTWRPRSRAASAAASASRSRSASRATWCPGPGAQLDASGNISRAQLGAILSALGQNSSQLRPATQTKLGRLQARAAKGAAAKSLYYLQSKNGRPTAVYKELGGGDSVPVLFITDQAPEYSKRWDLAGVVLSSLEHSRRDAFARAWSQALASAKP